MAEIVLDLALGTLASDIAPGGRVIVTQGTSTPGVPMFNDNPGAGLVTGVADLFASGFASRAVLHKPGGQPIAIVDCNSIGEYRFDGLGPGSYVVSLFDGSGTYKSETLHTVVP